MRILFAAVLAIFAAQPAAAQNQMQSGAGAIVNSISPNELISLLQTVSLKTRYVEQSDNTHFIEADNEGAVVYFALRDCAGAGMAARCGTLQPFGFFNGSGVTFSQLNAFNLERSTVAFSGLNSDGRGIIGSKFYLQAGVSPDHIPFSIGLFFVDVDALLASIQPGTLASFDYNKAPATDSKIANDARGLAHDGLRLASGEDWRVNAVGANAPSFMNDAFRAYIRRP